MLASSSRASYIAPSQTSPRRQSTAGSPGSTSPTTPTHTPRPRLPKRLSLPTPVRTPVLPCTQAEWRKTIAEVKRKYFSKRYRACSARCLEVLDGIKDVSQVEPVYLIYLHFYAATSMEICARPLPSTTALRASLLQQARTHFDTASELINAAEESVLKKFRPGSVGSSRASSCHSPSGSVSSRAWTPDTADTRLSSPTDSLCFFDDAPTKSPQSPPKLVKKVSFSLPKGAPLHIAAEPIIRPDSPTLGFDDGFYQCSPTTAQPIRQEEVLPKFHEIELPLQTIFEHEDDKLHETESETDTDTGANTQGNDDDDDDADAEYETSYHVARSVDRCCEHLSSLRAHLARHSTDLHNLLAFSSAATAAPQPPRSHPGSTPPPSGAVTETARGRGGGGGGEDRQARIERLRRSGWQRKRFDGRRYEELCEAVLAELA